MKPLKVFLTWIRNLLNRIDNLLEWFLFGPSDKKNTPPKKRGK